MELGAAVIARLEAVTAVTDLVGTRIYWVERPQGDPLPAVVMEVISSVPDQLLEGEGDFIVSRVQIAGLSRLRSEAHRIAAAASAALLDEATAGSGADTMDFEPADRTLPRDSGGESDGKGFVHRAISDVILRHSAGA